MAWEREGFTEALRTPNSTLVFVTPEKAREILADQTGCMGCLSTCRFSNWAQLEPDYRTGRRLIRAASVFRRHCRILLTRVTNQRRWSAT